jgi:hypothetical protein
VRRARAAAAGLALFAAAPALADGPAFRNVFHLDAEYEFDRLMGDVPWEWRDAFRAADTGVQTTGSSLNIRHFILDETVKLRLPLAEDRAWFRFRRTKRQGLERDTVITDLEFEYRPRGAWHVSLLGEPRFDKSDVDVGAAVRYGRAEGRSVKVAYLWPDFDANHAFHNTSVNEGFRLLHRRAPQEARLRADWSGGPWSLHAEGRAVRPWERVRDELIAPFDRSVERGAESEGALDAAFTRGGWTTRLEGESRRERASLVSEPAVPSEDRDVVTERHAARVSLQRDAGRWRARATTGFSRLRGRARHPADPALDEGYALLDRLASAHLFRRTGERVWWEGAFLYSRQRIDTLDPGRVEGTEPRSQNRGKLAVRYDFPAAGSLLAAAAVELDRDQSESFASFDGGTLQFQVTF